MHLSVNIFDVWVFRRRGAEAEFLLDRNGLRPKAIWAGEHAYLIYNDPSEHSEFAWLSREDCFNRVHYRGLKDGLRR